MLRYGRRLRFRISSRNRSQASVTGAEAEFALRTPLAGFEAPTFSTEKEILHNILHSKTANVFYLFINK